MRLGALRRREEGGIWFGGVKIEGLCEVVEVTNYALPFGGPARCGWQSGFRGVAWTLLKGVVFVQGVWDRSTMLREAGFRMSGRFSSFSESLTFFDQG